MKIYLGGTTSNSKWKENLKQLLNPLYFSFNKKKVKLSTSSWKSYDYIIFVFTPKNIDLLDIADLIDNSNKNPSKTIFTFIPIEGSREFTKHQKKSFIKTGEMIKINGGYWFQEINEIAEFLNLKVRY